MAVLCGLQMSVFLVAALNSLGMGATLIALSVVALDAWGRGGLMGKAYAPVIHAGAALLVSQGSSLLVDAPHGVHIARRLNLGRLCQPQLGCMSHKPACAPKSERCLVHTWVIRLATEAVCGQAVHASKR
jgi:hypothetical protein